MLERVFEGGLSVRRVVHYPDQGALVYVHGFGASGLCFEELMTDPLLSGWSHYAPDLIGAGTSPWPGRPFGLEDEVEVLGRWLAGSGLEKVVLVGHSMGGVVCLLLGERRPDLVKAFINIEGNLVEEDCAFSGLLAGQPLEVFRRDGYREFGDEILAAADKGQDMKDYYVSFRLWQPETLHRQALELVEVSRTGRPGRQDGGLGLSQIARLRVREFQLPRKNQAAFVRGRGGVACGQRGRAQPVRRPPPGIHRSHNALS